MDLIYGLIAFLLIGLFFYAVGYVTIFLFRLIFPKKPKVSKEKANLFIKTHMVDRENKRAYEEYIEWARKNNEPVIFDFESFQDKVNKKQDSKIKRLFK